MYGSGDDHDGIIGRQGDLKLNVMIGGAGICGLATAIALKRSGHNVTVFEANEAIQTVGVRASMLVVTKPAVAKRFCD